MDYREAAKTAHALVLKVIRDNPDRSTRYLTRQLNKAVNDLGDAAVLRALVNLGDFNSHEMTKTFLEEYHEDPEGIEPQVAAIIDQVAGLFEDDGKLNLSKMHDLTESNFALISACIADERMNALGSAIEHMQYRLGATDKLMTKLKPFLRDDADLSALRHIVEVNENVAWAD